MSNNRMVFTGLQELNAALRALPAHLVQEAAGIVTQHAQAATSQIIADYPEVTGNLKQHVKMNLTTSRGGVVARIRSTANHAFLYENGTQTRQTALGYNRGAMPPAHVFVPTIVRERGLMVQELIEMVNREGFQVTGG